MSDVIYGMAPVKGRKVEVKFADIDVSSDGSLNLLSEVERLSKMVKNISSSIRDDRVQGRVTHSFKDILQSRVFGICAGYIACSDIDRKKDDYLFKMAVGRDPENGESLPSTSTYCRFENEFNDKPEEVKKISESIIDEFCHHAYKGTKPESMCIDVDETFVEVHGNQTEMCFNKYYNGHGFLPMHFYDFATKWCLGAIHRPAKTPSGEESSENISTVVKQVRKHFTQTIIMIRGDSHYCTKEVVTWCLKHKNTEYIFGLSQNNTLNLHPKVKESEALAIQQAKENEALIIKRAKANEENDLEPTATTFTELEYVPEKWPCKKQRVIARSTATVSGDKCTVKTRYVMTSLKGKSAQSIYEKYYSPRGQAENFIKEHKAQLHSDRTSCTHPVANQFRLNIHTMAHNIFCMFRREIPAYFHLSRAEIRTLQKELIRIPVQIQTTKSRIILTYSTTYKHHELYLIILNNIRKNTKSRNRYPCSSKRLINTSL